MPTKSRTAGLPRSLGEINKKLVYHNDKIAFHQNEVAYYQSIREIYFKHHPDEKPDKATESAPEALKAVTVPQPVVHKVGGKP